MSDKRFNENIEKWSKSQPKIARLVSYADTSEFNFALAEDGELNFAKSHNGQKKYYHDQKSPEEEARLWFSSLDLNKVLVLYVYGVGLGYYYDAAREWLKKKRDRCLVFLEDDLGVIRALFETPQGGRLLRDKQVQLLFFRDLSDQEDAFENLYWDFALAKMSISALKCYEETKKESYERLQRKIAYDAAVKNALLDEYLRFGGAFFINYYQNILELPGSYLGNKFFKQYSEVPAIICGAGPSLEKNIEILKGLQDKALIFAGGSAMNVLNAAGFLPHFGAGIDPNPAQLERLSTSQAYEVPYFYRNRMFHDAFMTIKGPRLYITGSGGYDIAQYFEEALGIEGDLIEEGHNVVNFCLEVAYAMGCNPIIFVGMDLGFTNLKAYAPGVVEDASMDRNRIVDEDDDDSKPLLKEDVNGKPIYTLWKWVAEADWIADFAKMHSDVTVLNATEGGIGFPDVQNVNLKDAAMNYLRRSYDLFNRVHADTQNSAMPWVTQGLVDQAVKDLRVSLSRVVDYFKILIEENKKIIEGLRHDAPLAPNYQSGRAALAETELADEPGYRYVCEIFNAVYMRMLSRQLHFLRASKNPATERKRQIKRFDLNNKRLTFLKNVAQINAELIDYAFKERGHI